MVKIKEHTKIDMKEFNCPKCGADDIVYTTMPTECYNCQEPYRFHVDDFRWRAERLSYHLYGKTLKGGTI